MSDEESGRGVGVSRPRVHILQVVCLHTVALFLTCRTLRKAGGKCPVGHFPPCLRSVRRVKHQCDCMQTRDLYYVDARAVNTDAATTFLLAHRSVREVVAASVATDCAPAYYRSRVCSQSHCFRHVVHF